MTTNVNLIWKVRIKMLNSSYWFNGIKDAQSAIVMQRFINSWTEESHYQILSFICIMYLKFNVRLWFHQTQVITKLASLYKIPSTLLILTSSISFFPHIIRNMPCSVYISVRVVWCVRFWVQMGLLFSPTLKGGDGWPRLLLHEHLWGCARYELVCTF